MELSEAQASDLEQVANLDKIGKSGKRSAHYKDKKKYNKNSEK